MIYSLNDIRQARALVTLKPNSTFFRNLAFTTSTRVSHASQNFSWFSGLIVGGFTHRAIAVKAPQPAALKLVGGAAE
jgi:hypothetical protein